MTIIRKRKLTNQQTRRLEKKQAPTDHLIEDDEGTDGIIVAHYGKQLEVQQTSGHDLKDFQHVNDIIWRCHTRTHLPLLVTGDRVRWIADEVSELGVITHLYPRTSLLQRPDRYHKLKPVAANVSLICIVFAPLPAPSSQLIDRYLVACEQATIKPLLLLNKADLIHENPEAAQWLAEYQQLGYETFMFDQSQEISALANKLSGETVAFVGQSGVGKSSIINRLAPYATQKVNEISAGSALGQHTTTTTRYLPFPSPEQPQGAVIDSPGIREFGLWHLDTDQIRQGFIEFHPYYGQCKFRNCTHVNEKGCALQAAAEAGEINPRRLESLNRLEKEAKTHSY